MSNLNNEFQTHWENVYKSKQVDAVSWYQQKPTKSLQLIEQFSPNINSIIDIGGGASVLVDELLKTGQLSISVLDISSAALAVSQQRLKHKAQEVEWIVGDMTNPELVLPEVDVWHDRAVFHFLTNNDDRNQYLLKAERSIKKDGILVISTFALDGPEKCSNLPIQRYSAEQLSHFFADKFSVVDTQYETHITPFDTTQSFVYVVLRKMV